MLQSIFKKAVNRETVSYLIFGVLTTLINYLTFVILNERGVNIVLTNFIAWFIAVIFAYFTNKIYVFNSKSFSFKTLISEFSGFITARILSLIFETVFIVVAVKICGMNTYFSKLVAAVGVVIINYFASKFYIFKDKKDNEPKTLWQKLALIDSDECSSSSLISGNITYVLSFIVPVIILIIIYKGREIYPFGEQCYLRSDMYHQYAPFFSELWYKLTNNESLTYSFNIGLGTNFTALSAYYLASPANWFIFLFPQKYIIEIMNVFIILKMACSSLTFTYYISKHYNTKSILAACFGVFYALSGYLAAYSWNIMWLDCILILPLVILGLEKLVKEDKYLMYTLSLGFCIFTNYYIAIMVCLAVVLLFVHNIIALPKPKYFYIYFKKVFNFALFSLIAGGLAACMLIPEIYAFKLSGSNEFVFPKVMETYFPILEMLVRHLPNVTVHMGLEHLPNIYCGSFVFLLFPLYMLNPKQELRTKVSKCIILLILLTSFNLNIPNFVWHGLHFPNSLPARQGFIYIFLLLTCCFEAAYNIKAFTKEQILKAFGVAMAFLIIAEYAYLGDTYPLKVMYMSGIFIIAYLIIALIHCFSKVSRYITIVLVIVISALECGMNMEETGLGTTSRTYYMNNFQDIAYLKNYLEDTDTGFYRTEIFHGYRSKNDTAWHNLKGVSTFSSTANAGVTEFLDKLGCETSFNAYSSHGLTNVSSAMLNVKYMLSDFARTEGNDLSYVASSGSTYLYENKYTLPIAYLVDRNLNDSWSFEIDNPFDIQNDFLYNNTGINNVFYRVMTTEDNGFTRITPEQSIHAYLYFPISSDMDVNVTINGITRSYNLHNIEVIDIGYLNVGDDVYIGNVPSNMEVYSYNEQDFITAFDTLKESSLNVTHHSETEIKGTLSASYDGAVMCSIPYEKGWKVYVDGKKTDTFAIKKAMLAFNVTSGEHDIRLVYSPAGLGAGIIISVFSAAMLLIIVIFDIKKQIKQKERER